ncbi:hypothetical protein MUK42_24923 [Musa troglodytarum]|uniref:Uncharacterized protein n=1 Tax=Musa troglodytarum TaxID=320322 RepID=A0A9E7EE83_9LILI|nr:hypothetical protein MUK42_24923 [Musa troglodytarum]
MVTKKGKSFAVGFFPSCSPSPVGEEDKARFRYQSLLLDYEELRKETESKKQRLHKANMRKLKLLAEVESEFITLYFWMVYNQINILVDGGSCRFLQMKYACLLKNPSGRTQYRLKNKTPQIRPFESLHNSCSSTVSERQALVGDAISTVREVDLPRTSTIIDLNQEAEEMEEFQVTWEPLKADTSKSCSMNGDVVANDLKLPICRDMGIRPAILNRGKLHDTI